MLGLRCESVNADAADRKDNERSLRSALSAKMGAVLGDHFFFLPRVE
jgi:hypothetical protein